MPSSSSGHYYGLEGHGDEPTGQTVSGNAHADPLSSEPQWEDLIAVYPCDWPKSNGEGGDDRQNHDDADDDCPHCLFIRVAIDDSQHKPQEGKGEHHAGHAREREISPSLQVNRPKMSPLELTSNQGSILVFFQGLPMKIQYQSTSQRIF